MFSNCRASLVIVLLLLAVHALFLGLTIQGINDFSGFIQDVVDAGDSCSYCSKASGVVFGKCDL